jgi:uncharacterized membrane protein YcaP (DUF421 family)
VLDLFEVRMPIAELVLRGSAIFWFLFLIFRFVMRRDVGAVGVADILVLVLIADASQNAMAGGYTTITEGFILVSTIVAWNWLFDYLAFKSKTVRRFVSPTRLLLIDAGKPQLRNLRRQYITLEDLRSMLRQQGIEAMDVVKKAYLEPDGQISVIKYPPEETADESGHKKQDRQPVA